MYLKPTKTYYTADGEQHARRAPFLLLMQPDVVDGSAVKGLAYPIRALVRKVALRQCGHWMMGTTRVKGHSLTISGAYGADGLTMSVPLDVYEQGVDVPAELVEQWKHNGGWNSCGSEAPAMRKWACETFNV